MTATQEQLQATVEAYVDRLGSGTTDEIVSLFSPSASVEDPVGKPARTTPEEIRALFAGLEGTDRKTTLGMVRICGTDALFGFEMVCSAPGMTYTISTYDVMTFDDDAKITTMRAFWREQDVKVS